MAEDKILPLSERMEDAIWRIIEGPVPELMEYKAEVAKLEQAVREIWEITDPRRTRHMEMSDETKQIIKDLSDYIPNA